MSLLDTIANVSISKATKYPSRKGFGVPMLVAYHSFWLDRVRSFESLSELTDAGVPTTHAIYVAAQKCFSAPQPPEAIVIGRRTSAFTQIVKMRPQIATEGHVYRFKVKDPTQVITEIEYTVPGSATLSSVGTAIAALIAPATDIGSASVSGEITNTTVAGKIATYYDLPPISELEIEETTTDPGIAADLSAIETATENADGISWYGFSLDCGGQATTLAAAAWAEARQVVFSSVSCDSECADSGTSDDTISELRDLSYARTIVHFDQSSTQGYMDLCFLANQLPQEPGSTQGAYKTLPGVSPSKLTSGERNAIISKGGNVYVTTNQVNHTFKGQTPSGEWFDVTVFLDWLYARIQESVFGGQLNQRKVPYTQKGIDTAAGWIQAVLTAGTQEPNPGLAEYPPPTITIPKIAAVSSANKAARTLANIPFSATLSGAIVLVSVRGNVIV